MPTCSRTAIFSCGWRRASPPTAPLKFSSASRMAHGRLIQVPIGDVDTFRLIDMGADGNTLYFLDSRERDRAALFSMDMTTRETRLLAADDEADIVEATLDEQRRPADGERVLRARQRKRRICTARPRAARGAQTAGPTQGAGRRTAAQDAAGDGDPWRSLCARRLGLQFNPSMARQPRLCGVERQLSRLDRIRQGVHQ